MRRDARDKVQWAAPYQEGEQTKARVYRAFTELRVLTHGLVKKAWYEEIGPYEYAAVHNAWLELAQRRAAEEAAPWSIYVNNAMAEPATQAEIHLAKTVAELRRTG